MRQIGSISWIGLRYVPLEPLGGRDASVMKARDRLAPPDSSWVVLKSAREPIAREALTREVELLNRLVHPSIRQVVAHGRDDDEVVAVLEYLEGDELDKHLTKSPERVGPCVEGVLRALVYLHAQGLSHGDLKPANIVVADSEPRLIDLELATSLGSTRQGGTVGFLAPEYLEGGVTSVAGDLFGLGATICALEPSCGHLDDRISRLARACVAARPELRPASADSALAILGALPRPVDRSGQFTREGSVEALTEAQRALERLDGSTIVVEGEPGSGRTRLLVDALRPAIARGQPIMDGSLAGGHDPFHALAALLDVGFLDDPERAISIATSTLAHSGVAIVMDDADEASAVTRRILLIIAATLSELGRGAMLVVGADEALSAELVRIRATRVALEPVDDVAVATMLEATCAAIEPGVTEALVRCTGGRAGECARAAQMISERSEVTPPAEIERLLSGRANRGDQPVDISLSTSDDALERATRALEDAMPSLAIELLQRGFHDIESDPHRHPEAAAIMARALARLGYLERAAEIVVSLGQRASPDLVLGALQWLERAGRYEVTRRLGENLLGTGVTLPSGEVSAIVALAVYGLGDPDGAHQIAQRALDEDELHPTTRCRLLCVESDVALTRGDITSAVRDARRAQEVARDGDDPTVLPWAIAREAAARALGGEPGEARDRYREAYKTALNAGDVMGLPPHVLNLATAEHAVGQLGVALERYQHAARLAGDLGRTAIRAAALVNLAGLLVHIGARDEASQVLEDAKVSASEVGSAIYSAQAQLIQAELQGAQTPSQGRRGAIAARDAFIDCGATVQALECELAEAELALDMSEVEPSRNLVRRRSTDLARAGLDGRAFLLLARAELLDEAPRRALERAEEAATIAAKLGDKEVEARALDTAALAHGRLGTGAERAILLRAQEALGSVVATLPSGFRERFLQTPARQSVMRHGTSSDDGVTQRTGIRPARFFGLIRRLLLEVSESRLLEAAVDEALELVEAERAMLLRTSSVGRPSIAVARNIARETIEADEGKLRYSRTVAEQVISSGECVVMASPPEHPSLGGTASVLDLGLRSILCVPVRSPSSIVGALYLDTRFESGRFGQEEAELVQGLGDIIGVALDKARLYREATENAHRLERAYVDKSRESERRQAELERMSRLLEQGGLLTEKVVGGMVGRSRVLKATLEVARRVAKSDITVLIEGESGTGKELLARYVHAESERGSAPFVALNCGAVPDALLESELFGHVRGAFTGATRDHPGVFRTAEGGTVLLDEIGEMSLTMQPRLLRVLQEGELWPLGMERPVPVDIRVIASTNRDLEAEVDGGRFRRDLYYRLLGMRLELKPLRERMEDIPLLAEHLLERIASEPGMRRVRLSKESIRELMRQSWPGNVRELEQVLRRTVALTDDQLLEPSHLALSPGIHSRREALREFDRELVEQALRASSGNRSAAARALGISRATIHRWIRRHKIEL